MTMQQDNTTDGTDVVMSEPEATSTTTQQTGKDTEMREQSTAADSNTPTGTTDNGSAELPQTSSKE